ncbi:hypothetical protein PR048_029483 [Dryococelus australis]|uniref:Uncharacterized protein n=1 Tax=Dryococelus australis TaxID=614101 RepID=A0ABQ9GFS3_9NEOP|nr:hypothetical protein PR048_029483 [Dryococelus australis]
MEQRRNARAGGNVKISEKNPPISSIARLDNPGVAIDGASRPEKVEWGRSRPRFVVREHPSQHSYGVVPRNHGGTGIRMAASGFEPSLYKSSRCFGAWNLPPSSGETLESVNNRSRRNNMNSPLPLNFKDKNKYLRLRCLAQREERCNWDFWPKDWWQQLRVLLKLNKIGYGVICVGHHDGNTARLARRSDKALGVRVSVARIAPSLLDQFCGNRGHRKPATFGLNTFLKDSSAVENFGTLPWRKRCRKDDDEEKRGADCGETMRSRTEFTTLATCESSHGQFVNTAREGWELLLCDSGNGGVICVNAGSSARDPTLASARSVYVAARVNIAKCETVILGDVVPSPLPLFGYNGRCMTFTAAGEMCQGRCSAEENATQLENNLRVPTERKPNGMLEKQRNFSPQGPPWPSVGIVPDDDAGRRVFSGISPFPPTFHSGGAPYSLQSPTSAPETSLLRAAQISSLTHTTHFAPHSGNDLRVSPAVDACAWADGTARPAGAGLHSDRRRRAFHPSCPTLHPSPRLHDASHHLPPLFYEVLGVSHPSVLDSQLSQLIQDGVICLLVFRSGPLARSPTLNPSEPTSPEVGGLAGGFAGKAIQSKRQTAGGDKMFAERPKSRVCSRGGIWQEKKRHEVMKIWLPSKSKAHQTIIYDNWTAASVQLVAIVDVAVIRSGQYPPGLQDILLILKSFGSAWH